MILAIDMGNTSCTFGLCQGKTVRGTWHLPTRMIPRQRFIAVLREQMKRQAVPLSAIETVAICSVVPAMERVLSTQLKKIFVAAQVGFLGKEIAIPVKNSYRFPKQVGNDRLANAVGARYCYPLPALVVDFGTAITIDCISRDGTYRGGVIAPGIATSLKALYEETALLPLITLRKPRKLIGRDTEESMLSGVVYGSSFMVDGLIEALKHKQKTPVTVIGTGGHLSLMKKLCKNIDYFDQLLTLKGIEIACNSAKIKQNKL